jgi:hypothetical protein
VIEFEDLPKLQNPVVLAAFEGWNDAAEAATSALDHLHEIWEASHIGALDPEEFYDFQVNRPTVGFDSLGNRQLSWPTTELSLARLPHQDLILVRGIEPNIRWRKFATDLLTACDELGAQMVVTLGALLADVPHTRPIPVTGTATDPELTETLNLERSTYEGPTGIVGVLQDACQQLGIPAVSYWASVPHYVAQPPCPKASLSLIGKVESLLGCTVDLKELPEDSRAWERGVNELASDDEEIAEYVKALEESRDAADLPEASGEAIAMEFERYLKRRDEEPT